MKQYLTAQEAAEELGISVATVYAYVSRGLIRSEPVSGNSRRRRYSGEDVAHLKQRQEQRYHPEKAADTALYFGVPLLESGLTLIADGSLYYRGQDVILLAQQQMFEAVATLLWTGALSHPLVDWDHRSEPLTRRCAVLLELLPEAAPFERFQALLPLAALDDLAAYDVRLANVLRAGVRILNVMVAGITDQTAAQGSIAARIQQAWTPDNSHAAFLLNMALILCADHELNVSSFTARCAASAGSTPYAVVSAGLAALQGPKHGGNTERVMALLREISSTGAVRAALVNRIKRGEALPGFGHPLYPQGDPRARLLLETLESMYPADESAQRAGAIVQAVNELTGDQPSIDFGLAVLADVLKLPAGAPLALFALGRSAGWIGHALEQYAADQIIRPRARYTGILPDI
jgi:citrate synthase